MDNKFINLKNVTKDDKDNRLQSLRLPRDLSLGGSKLKKVYTPNLNVVRNKDKPKEFMKRPDLRRKDQNRSDKRHNKVNNNKDRFVQSAGIFSEGAGEIKRFREKRANTKDNDTNSGMVLPTIKKNAWTVNKKAEDVIFDELTTCDNESDDEKMSFQPLTWCEGDLKEVKVLEKMKSEKTDEVKVKIEDNENLVTPQFKQLNLQTSSLPREFQDENTYSDNNPSLTIWNLPDSFAGKGLSDDPSIRKLFDYPLTGMLDGHVGKIYVRKSGRMEVYLGRVKYDLEPMELIPCMEEIMALDIKDNHQQTAAAELGQVQNRYILNPDWNSLLK